MTDNEIIEALATNVMGWTTCDAGCHWDDGSKRAQEMPVRDERKLPDLMGGVQWNPLTNPADSKQVREKLAERFPTYTLERCAGSYYFGVLDPEMQQKIKETGDTFGEYSDTEERAVALCALKTVGVEV